MRVAAIGASAGGLEAFTDLVSAIPVDTGLAFVLIQHLDRRHDSMLAAILAAATTLPVQEVVDGMTIERNHIYVIPPDTHLTVEGNVLRLAPRSTKVPHRPLDGFFCSLAVDRKGDAIGVVLSGNDADGALGLQAIRDAGGTTFAQAPGTAKFEIMPRAAASAADFILPPVAIAERLASVAAGTLSDEGADPAAIEHILRLLSAHHTVDFSHFKRGSFERRIARRVLLGNHASTSSYAASLENDSVAVEALYQDLLIGVTSFFREPERFEALKTIVFPAIAENRTRRESIRIWVAGCSTGEEVYSLGIMLLEFLDGRDNPPRIYIYGTDINEQSLARARAATYPEQALVDFTPERLARFFTPTAGGYKVAKEVRELCVFAAHDVTRDPPYSRIDLVTCCNVLIYFDAELQKKAVALLEYAVAAGGFLMLGGSESLRGASSDLTAISANPLIYRKRAVPARLAALEIAPRSTQPLREAALPPPFARRASGGSDEDDAFLAAHLAPAAVLVDDQMQISRIRGDVTPFIALEPGDVSLDLFALLRHHEILAVLRPAVRRAFREQAAVTRDDVLVFDGEVRRRVAFEVIPFGASPSGRGRCWVVFRTDTVPASAETARNQSEIDGLRGALAAAIDDREQLADEASAAAEEAQSSDEELRSTNEELETAKEELQSANEELSTLNDELRLRNTALVKMNDDIENLLGAVEIPILFVSRDLAVQRFNTTAGKLLNLQHHATGRALREIESSLDVDQLEKLIGAVIGTNTSADVEVQDSAADWWLLRIRPYRTSEGKIDGAIVAVVDINVLKRSVLAAEETTRAANTLSEASALLASSLDYETTLESLANLCTGTFADWCAVDLVNDDGSIRHLTVAHVNPVLRDLALQFQKTTFGERETAPGAAQALRLRTPVLLNEFAGSAGDTRFGQLVGALGMRSLISVPMIVRDRVLGTVTFCSSKRLYQTADLKLAEALTQRAAIALDMAVLFREAESANRFKDAFLGTVAHELRTPLTSIVGWVQLAQRNAGMVEECLTHVASSASLMRVFVEDLLDVARIREQKLSLEVTDIDFADVVRSAIEMTVLAASGRDIQVRFHLEGESVPLQGDSIRLMQVVWNLLSNAIKFTEPGGKIDVRLDRNGSDARLVVTDTGAGISPEFAPHAFELYRQADETGAHTPGLGIGLSIVAEIVKLHGGTVRVESPGLGRGSTFTITLPMTAPADPPRPERRSVNTRRAGDRRVQITKPEEPS